MLSMAPTTSLVQVMDVLVRTRVDVIDSAIDALEWEQAIGRIDDWAGRRESRVVCICNVHSVVTARTDPAFAAVLARADMATPDGAPLAWMIRWLVGRAQPRVNGPDLMWRYCGHAALNGTPVFLYGGTDSTLRELQLRLLEHFPGLRIVGGYAPPFRPLSEDEDAAVVAAINASGAGVVWVGLGCPKQEKWMDAHRGRINAVMIGVGAAFDYHSGRIRRAPLWMQRAGLEWLHRLCSEPRRLFRRYFTTNAVFIWHAIGQWWKYRRMAPQARLASAQSLVSARLRS